MATLLRALGLSYSLRSDEYATDVTVGLTPELVHNFDAAPDARTVGLLFGYPQTAVDAYAHDNLLSEEEQQAVDEAAGLSSIGFFRYSRDRWQDEQTIARHWFDVLRAYDLA